MTTKTNFNKTDSPGGVANQIPQTDQRVIYEYVHANEPVDREEIRRELFEYDRRAFEHNLTQFVRNDHLVIEDGTIRIALDLKSFSKPATIDLSDIDSPVTIRLARQQDRTAIIETMREVAGDGVHLETEAVAQRIESEHRLHRHDEGNIRVFFIGTIDDDIAGWVHLTASPQQQLRHTAKLTGGVVERYRRPDSVVDSSIGAWTGPVPRDSTGYISTFPRRT